MIMARRNGCEEAALGMGDAYFPCNRPATKIISVNRPGSTEGPYRMCDACADHSVRSRGMKEVGPYVEIWTFRRIDIRTGSGNRDGFGFVEDGNGHDVLHVGDRGLPAADNIAIGVLSAGAPTMLAALCIAAASFDALAIVFDENKMTAMADLARKYLTEVLVAIRKATCTDDFSQGG